MDFGIDNHEYRLSFCRCWEHYLYRLFLHFHLFSRYPKIFGNKSDKDIKRLTPIIADINSEFDKLQSFTDQEIVQKYESLKDQLKKEIDLATVKAVDTYLRHKQWVASKLAPKTFGTDKQQNSLTGSNGQKLEIEWQKD